MLSSDRLAPLKSLAITFLCQLIGAWIATGMGFLGFPFLVLFIFHSFFSGYLSIFFRLSVPWRFINFMIPAGILVSQAFPGYGWVWLVFLVVFGLIFLPTFWTRVPYYPSSNLVYELIANELPKDKAFKFIDIGCGDGKLIAYLAEKFPNGEFHGSDLSPSAIFASKLGTKGMKNVTIRLEDFWKKEFSEFDFIYAFLSPTPMKELEDKYINECTRQTKLLVNSFALPSLSPSKEVPINSKNQTSLFIYSKE